MLPTIIFNKKTAGAHKEPSKKYKRNLRTLKSYEEPLVGKRNFIEKKMLPHNIMTISMIGKLRVINLITLYVTSNDNFHYFEMTNL